MSVLSFGVSFVIFVFSIILTHIFVLMRFSKCLLSIL
jgi:hypothetical protein